jgi:chromosome segregation ATPase
LQRGTVPGGDANVAFLCQKYTALLERLRLAEDGERHLEACAAGISTEIRSEEAAEEAERSELEAAANSVKEDVLKLEADISEARAEEALAQEDLCKARAEAEDCQSRRAALDEQCASERSRLVEVNSRFRQLQIKRPASQTELKRLQSQLQTLKAQYNAASEELTGHRERATRDEAQLSELKAEALSEEESRDHASELAAKHREELSEALSELSLLKERLTEAQVGVQRCEDELERRAERRLAIQAEIQKYDIWLGNASRQMEDLHEVDRGLARVHIDTTEVRANLSLEEAEVRSAEAASEVKEAAVEKAEREFLEQAQRLKATEGERESLQSEVRNAEEEQSQLEAVIEQLHHDQATSGGLRRNLEHETQLLLAEAERLRKERDVQVAERSEMLQRLRLLTPALTDARRRARELEDSVEAMRAEATRERQLADRLEREAGVCQDKMRVLRDQNVRLAEQCTELEAQLACASSRRPQALRARSTSACGSRTRSTTSIDRPRRGSRGPLANGSSSARGGAILPLGLRMPLTVRGRFGSEAEVEDPAIHDVVLIGEHPMQPPAASQRPSAPLSVDALGPDIEIDAHGMNQSRDFELDGGGASRSAGTTPREASRNHNLQYLKEWIQSEDERLGGTPRRE